MARRQTEPLVWLERLNAAREQLDGPTDDPTASEAADWAATIDRERSARVRAEQRADDLASLVAAERSARRAAEQAAQAAQAEARQARHAAWEVVRRRDERRRRPGLWRRARLRLR